MKKISWILLKAVKNCYKYLIMYIGILLLCSLFSVSVNLLNKQIVNELADNISIGELTYVFIVLTIAYVLIYFINSAAGFLTVFGVNSFRLNVDLAFYKMFMWKTNQLAQENFFDYKFMDQYSFVYKNITKISSFIGNILNLLFFNVTTIASALVLFSIYEPFLLLYMGVVIVITILSHKKFATQQYGLDVKQLNEQRYCDYYKSILTDKKFAKEMRIYKFRDYIYQKWIDSFEKLRKEKLDLEIKKLNAQNSSSLVKLLLRCLSILLLVFGAFQHKYDVGTFVLLLGLVETSSGHIDTIVSSVMSGTYADSKYLADYYDYIMPITNEDISQLKENTIDNGDIVWGSFENLELKNISYKYPNSNEEAIKNISLKINKGEIVCILGYNGSGKTTLSKIINGSLNPKKGEILLNGNVVNEKNRNIVFRYFGMAPQEFSKYAISIQDMVGLGRIELMNTESALSNAYKKANLNEFIKKCPKGLQTILGKEYDEEGVDLSGGEWQWLTIASAYMGEPEILLMDEPSASLDPIMELEMLNNFRTVLGDKTAIIISHKMCFARIADNIIMMRDGKICETGTHDELIKKEGYYAQIFNEQKNLYDLND